jgi:hypothetical protein
MSKTKRVILCLSKTELQKRLAKLDEMRADTPEQAAARDAAMQKPDGDTKRTVRDDAPFALRTRNKSGAIYWTKQTFTADAILRPHPPETLEEATEILDKIEKGDRAVLKGDVERIKNNRRKRIFPVALRWWYGELIGKHYFEELARLHIKPDPSLKRILGVPPSSYVDCLPSRTACQAVRDEAESVVHEAGITGKRPHRARIVQQTDPLKSRTKPL